jgi:peptidoglycan/xylan/chitin deacetylase (PgdA/CDA1 family)
MMKRILLVTVSLGRHLLVGGARRLIELVGTTPRARTLVVLTYHAVTADDVDRFASQMRLLKRRARVVFADDAAAAGTRPAVAVTFDDAFQCVFDHALPLLARLEIPATVFVPTAYLGADAGWRSDGPALSDLPRPVVSAAALTALDPSRVRIGSHTVTHPHLAVLPPARLKAELVGSRTTLEALTGAPVNLLAVPYGCFNVGVVEAARLTGYTRVFANMPLALAARTSPTLHGRVNVSPRDWRLEFYLKATGSYAWLATAIAAKRMLLSLLGHRNTC